MKRVQGFVITRINGQKTVIPALAGITGGVEKRFTFRLAFWQALHFAKRAYIDVNCLDLRIQIDSFQYGLRFVLSFSFE